MPGIQVAVCMNTLEDVTLMEMIDAEADGQEQIPVIHVFAVAVGRRVIQNRTQAFNLDVGLAV